MSWYQLLSIYREGEQTQRELQAIGPWACPNDGEPLIMGAHGIRFCRYDGWQYPRDWDGKV